MKNRIGQLYGVNGVCVAFRDISEFKQANTATAINKVDLF